MNLLEFKRRLMTDPNDRDEAFQAARNQGDEFARAASESDAFERKLKRALDVPVPDKLAEEIILRQSMEPASRRRLPARWLAVAAAVVMSLVVGLVMLLPGDHPHGNGLYEHLAWHWEMDGASALQASRQSPTEREEVQRIFAELGLQADEALLEQVRLSKFCPTPDGAGAHVVLTTEEGPVTLFYMPRTTVADAPRQVSLPDGMEGWLVNLERGSMAVVAEAGVDKPRVAREIERQLNFKPGLNL